MKKVFSTFMLIAMLATLGACNNQQAEQSSSDNEPVSQVESVDVDAPDAEPDEFAIEMTSENQEYCDKFMTPLAYSAFFWESFDSRNPENITWLDHGIITIYQDLVGMDVWIEKAGDAFSISASDVEEVLMNYFPFDTETIRRLAGEYYDAEKGEYLMVERGGGPRVIQVTDNAIEDSLLTLRYTLYGPHESDPERLAEAYTGTVEIQFLVDGSYRYLSNTMSEI